MPRDGIFGIQVRTDPLLTPGTLVLHSGICDWGDQKLGEPAHTSATRWRITVGCRHEHLDTRYLCDECCERSQSMADRGIMMCKSCRHASGNEHFCRAVVLTVVPLGGGDEPTD